MRSKRVSSAPAAEMLPVRRPFAHRRPLHLPRDVQLLHPGGVREDCGGCHFRAVLPLARDERHRGHGEPGRRRGRLRQPDQRDVDVRGRGRREAEDSSVQPGRARRGGAGCRRGRRADQLGEGPPATAVQRRRGPGRGLGAGGDRQPAAVAPAVAAVASVPDVAPGALRRARAAAAVAAARPPAAARRTHRTTEAPEAAAQAAAPAPPPASAALAAFSTFTASQAPSESTAADPSSASGPTAPSRRCGLPPSGCVSLHDRGTNLRREWLFCDFPVVLTSMRLPASSRAAGQFTGQFYLEGFYGVLSNTQRSQFGLAIFSAMAALGQQSSVIAETRFTFGSPRIWTTRKDTRIPSTFGGTMLPFTLLTNPNYVASVSDSLLTTMLASSAQRPPPLPLCVLFPRAKASERFPPPFHDVPRTLCGLPQTRPPCRASSAPLGYPHSSCVLRTCGLVSPAPCSLHGSRTPNETLPEGRERPSAQAVSLLSLTGSDGTSYMGRDHRVEVVRCSPLQPSLRCHSLQACILPVPQGRR